MTGKINVALPLFDVPFLGPAVPAWDARMPSSVGLCTYIVQPASLKKLAGAPPPHNRQPYLAPVRKVSSRKLSS